MAYEIEPGICRFCRDAPDGDKVSFIDQKATRCNKPGCVIAWQRWYDLGVRQEEQRIKLVCKLKKQLGSKKKVQRRRAA